MKKVETMRGRRPVPDGQQRWGLWSAVGLLPLMAACSSGADADEPQPTVLETGSPVADDESTTAVDEDSNGSEEPSEQEVENSGAPDPVPASSEGPAENWPEPEIPDEIYEPTEEGAEALIQYWFDARHHARITGEVEVLEYVSLADCQICVAEIDRVEEAYEMGWYLEDAANRVDDSFVRLESEDAASGLFILEELPFQLYWNGELHSEQTSTSLEGFGLDVRFVDGRWKVFHFSHLGPADEVGDVTEGGG